MVSGKWCSIASWPLGCLALSSVRAQMNKWREGGLRKHHRSVPRLHLFSSLFSNWPGWWEFSGSLSIGHWLLPSFQRKGNVSACLGGYFQTKQENCLVTGPNKNNAPLNLTSLMDSHAVSQSVANQNSSLNGWYTDHKDSSLLNANRSRTKQFRMS